MRTLPSLSAFAVALAVTVLAQSAAVAQAADAQEVSRYVLTDAGLAKYIQSAKNLAAVPGIAENACKEDDAANSESIAELVAELDAMPGAKGAIQAAGMTSREYVVFSMSLLQSSLAGWALDQPGGKLPPGVSMANVDFVKRHEADLKQLEGISGDMDCSGAEPEEDTGA